MKFLVLGAGKQGSAAAFDLARRDVVDQVVLADQHVSSLPPFLEPFRGGKLLPLSLDASDHERVKGTMVGMDGVVCALPYYLNLAMARLAVEAGAHFCDLGGNTEIVERQLALSDSAAAKGLSVIPDCGLAPGMVNILAEAGIEALDQTDSVAIKVGGLPQDPEPPLDYQIVYSLEGVLDYYTTDAVILKDGRETKVKALDGLELVSFPEPLGELEAFYTAGGISTMPTRYSGTIREMEYKTLRYPGHARIMKAIRGLGLLELEPVEVDGSTVVPRRVFIASASPRLRKPGGRDLVAMRVEVRGEKEGGSRTIRYELVDYYDEENGITAMMRTTGYSLAITALMQADGRIEEKGVRTPDRAVPADAYVKELAARGVVIRRTEG